MKKMIEIWKNISWAHGYQVSNFGNVRSVDREVNHPNGVAIKKGKLLKPFKNKRGYLEMILLINGIKFHKTIHRLVADAFIPNPNNYPMINHKDENKTNNVVENLEWCTHKYNCNYGTSVERSSINRTNKMVRITKDKTFIYKSSKIASKLIGVCVASIRYRVNKGFLKDTATKELIETWRVANQKEKDLLGDKDYITLNNSEVIS